MPVLTGTSGWSYKDWEGIVYPKGLAPGERLASYAARLPTVEVNTTFYRTPPARMLDGWIEKTRHLPRFELTVKAPQELTQDVLAKGSPDEAASVAAQWAELVARPLADAGRLGALFLQLSPGVLHNERALDRLDHALAALEPYPVAVELRNRTWLQDGGVARDALEVLDAHDVACVAVDGPSFPAIVEGDASHAYVRFHGRNADVWHRGRKVEKDAEDPRMNRYDYFYDEKELRPWVDRVERLAQEKRVVRVYFNNHPGGQAFHDARLFEGMLAEMRLPAGPAAARVSARAAR